MAGAARIDASSLFTVSSPFAGIGAKAETLKVLAEPVTLPGTDENPADAVSYLYSPPGSISLLSNEASSVLLTAQAGEPPAILRQSKTSQVYAQDFTPRPSGGISAAPERTGFSPSITDATTKPAGGVTVAAGNIVTQSVDLSV